MQAYLHTRLKSDSTSEGVFYFDSGMTKEEVTTGIRCIAYLLESISCRGNDAIDGQVAQGFSLALKHYARNVEIYLKSRHDQD
jgi:hypothetical protein